MFLAKMNKTNYKHEDKNKQFNNNSKYNTYILRTKERKINK